MKKPQPRPGFTILEVVLVLAILLIIAAIVIPSFSGLSGNVRQKAAADLIRARIADGRTRAIEYGVPYRLAIHQDGTRIRLAPDGPEFATLPAADVAGPTSRVTDEKFEKATGGVAGTDSESVQPTADESGWVTVAIFLPDGSCKEDISIVQVHEGDFPPLRILVRGITGGSKILPNTTSKGGLAP